MDHVNDDDHQELESLETLSLTDFPLTEHRDSDDQDHKHGYQYHDLQSPARDQDLFEFGSSGLKQHMMNMSHAEDIISFGKLIPIKDQQQPQKTQNDIKHNQKHIIHSGRCESMRELKSNTNKKTASDQLFRNSHSLDYKKLNRNSKLNYEPTADIYANRNSLSTKSFSSRWSDLVFAPLKVPQEMDLRDIRNRQIVQSTSNRFSFNGSKGDHHRKTSWGVLGFLSCKSSGSVAVTMPLS